MGFKKKLFRFPPGQQFPTIETQVSKQRSERVDSDPRSLERGVRQRLADKVSGTLAGIWLLVAEHLRLGTWDLLCGWTGKSTECVEPRLAMQLVHEAAVCTRCIRAKRTLQNRAGFELANGLPFVASDQAIHYLLDSLQVADAMKLQVALGKLRRASGHFQGKVIAIDPHRTRSYSRRHMRTRSGPTGTPILWYLCNIFVNSLQEPAYFDLPSGSNGGCPCATRLGKGGRVT